MNDISSAHSLAFHEMSATRITDNHSTLPGSGILRTDLSHLFGINSGAQTTFSENDLAWLRIGVNGRVG